MSLIIPCHRIYPEEISISDVRRGKKRVVGRCALVTTTGGSLVTIPFIKHTAALSRLGIRAAQ